MASNLFDLIVLGAGPGGYVAAIRASQLGLNVAVVEREHLGGICLNWGCIPTKAMLRSAEVYHLAERAKEFGLSAEKISFDLNKIVERSRKISGQLNQGVGHLLKKNKVTVFSGEAKLLDRSNVSINSDGKYEKITAKNIVLATGARARELPGMEADGDLVWTYKHALTPSRMPKKLLVIGSGAIGVEFASFYNTFGANTTIVEVLDRILPVEDEDVSSLAAEQFAKQGMTIKTGAKVQKLEKKKNQVVASIDCNGVTEVLEFDTVISAVGIIGNIEGLGLEEVGVETKANHVVTDEYCETTASGIYAIGDLTGAPWLAHKASHEGVLVAEKIAGQSVKPINPIAIPGCTYSYPQIASVGLTEAQAQKAGYKINVGKFPFIGNGKAIALGEKEGFIKTIFDTSSGELLGAHMIGAEVTELIQGYVIGQALETTEDDLIHAVFPHPTLSEMMHESVLDAHSRVIHY
ncbi:MAG: dihydrolipoyl dehydrogenase [Marinovum sp.]|jgi:dihydrolipoamide dehydrogenase|nr:dihydrolipoyl dehydrogenase [Marinovum sp.]GIR44600.1 MAG: dihydrolipoyl dehydrogenase [Paracoccaceae bacterium]|tara:strand:+ start:773 stop:2167 length:1395 start_codon:yes stop_codon:yes gene_type:complete